MYGGYPGYAPLQPATLQVTWRWAWPSLSMAVNEYCRAYQGILGFTRASLDQNIKSGWEWYCLCLSVLGPTCTQKFSWARRNVWLSLCYRLICHTLSNEDRPSHGAVLPPISMMSWSDRKSLSSVCSLICKEGSVLKQNSMSGCLA